MISEDRLRQAVRDAGALLDQSLPDPDQCHHTFSPAFLNRMEALLRRRKRAPVYRVLKGVACFFLAFLLGGTIFLSTNAQAREAFFGWLSEQIGGTVDYRFHNDVSEATHRYRLSEIPSGYWETDRYEAETTGDELYENEAGEYLSFSYQYVTEDTESKVSDMNSRSKSEQVGYMAWTLPSAAFRFIPLRRLTEVTISSRILREAVWGLRNDITPLI